MKRQIKVSKQVNTKSAPNFMNGNIMSESLIQNDKLCKEQFEKIRSDIFKGYTTTGKEDNTSKKAIYNLSHDPERIPGIITEILTCIQSKTKVPENSKPIVKFYYFSRNSKCMMDVPHENLGMRVLLNYNHSEVFYLDPIYEKINNEGNKEYFSTDLPEKYMKIVSNNYAILAPGNMYRYTIRDIKDEKIKNNHMDSEYSRNKMSPRVSNYERINITIDYVLPDHLAAKMKELQAETITKMAVQSGISQKNLKKQIDNLKSNPNVQRSAAEYNKLINPSAAGGDRDKNTKEEEEDTLSLLTEMNKVNEDNKLINPSAAADRDKNTKEEEDTLSLLTEMNKVNEEEDNILIEMNKVNEEEKDTLLIGVNAEGDKEEKEEKK
jgi:hypothetical protein